MDYKTINNLVTLVNMLQSSVHGVPLKEIRSRLDLSDRQIDRLKDPLSYYFQIDIETEPDPYGATNAKRWVIRDPEKRLPIPRTLDDESWLLLQLLLGHSGIFESRGKKELVERLKDSMASTFIRDKKRHVKTSYVKFTGGREYVELDHNLATIASCLRKNEGATVTYRAQSTNVEKSYDIEPYTLVDHSGAFYLICAVPKHDQALVQLAIDRIVSLVPNGKRFSVPADYDPSAHLGESFGITVGEEPMSVVVRLFAEQAYYAKRRTWGKDQSAVDEGGSILLSFTASGKYEILRWLLSCGKDAELLGPPELVSMLKSELEGARSRYPE